MRCEWEGCKNKRKLKLSMPSGEIFCYCYKHSMKIFRALHRSIVKYNTSLFVQKYVEGK